MTHPPGSRSGRIFDLLQERILSGELAAGSRLPPHTRLAVDFGVAPMTIRTVLARLEAAGLISRELGRGTYVRQSTRPAVLVLAAPNLQAVLAEHIRRLGYTAVLADGHDEGLARLGTDHSVGLVLCEVPDPGGAGREAEDFIRAVRRRWPRLPLAAVTSSAANLAALLGTPESPVLMVPAPLRASQLEEVVRLALPALPAASLPDPPPREDRLTLDALTFRAQLLEAVEQAVIATDLQARILYWNRGAERLYGWSADEVLGRNVAEVIVAPKLMERGLEIVALLREGKSWTGEFPVLRRDGTEIPVLVTDSPIRDASGQLVGIIGVAVDLSERKLAELERLERTRLEALLTATAAAQQELSERLTLHVPHAGQLAADPRLPAHLRPIASTVLAAIRDVATRLEHSLELPDDG
jgi:PAS domain S-box-containing protein